MLSVQINPSELGFIINGTPFSFGIERTTTRSLLNQTFQEDNQVIEWEGAEKIIVRKDIYQGIHGEYNFLILHFDPQDKLTELEVHHCDQLCVNAACFDFEVSLDDVAGQLKTMSTGMYHQEFSGFFFPDLHISINSACNMGGEDTDNRLSYFYFVADVSHLWPEWE